jgi:hypothetical protein
MLRVVLGICFGVVAASAAPVIDAASNCTKAALLAAADSYVASLTAGDSSTVQKLAGNNFTYMENNKVIDIKTGVLKLALKIDHRRTNTDLVDCASYTELISASDSSKPYVIGTQIHHDPVTMTVTLVDTIASTKNSWAFDAAKTLKFVLGEDWAPIPEAKWDSRAKLQQAADAYLDMWSNATASDAVPWGTPCTRLEGSAYTGKGAADDSCKPGIPSNHNQAPNTHRRYVIDQEMGSCSVFCLWEHMMNAADSHEFRLENGKLRYVHTMTECGGKTCRL